MDSVLDIAASRYLFVEALERVGRPDLASVFDWETVVGEHIGLGLT
jgi:hypothetical protein